MAGKEIIISLIGKDNGLNFNSLSLISDENGSVYFALNLIEGNYSFLASYSGDSFYRHSNLTFNVSVSKRESPHIIAEETVINNGDEFKILLIDDEYNPIPNKLVNFVVYSDKKTLVNHTAKTNNSQKHSFTDYSHESSWRKQGNTYMIAFLDIQVIGYYLKGTASNIDIADH